MLRALYEALRSESKDRQTVAAGKQAAGAAMIADGLVGLENPLDDKKSRMGIGGALVMIVLGIAIIVASQAFAGSMDASQGDIVVKGEVVEHLTRTSTRDGETRTLFTPVVRYTDPATGESYEVTPSWSSSSVRSIGDSYNVAFAPGTPAAGKVLTSATSWIKWIGLAIGLLLVLAGLGKFIVRLVTIGAGVKLLLDGRRERREMGDDRSVLASLMDGADDVVTDVMTARNESTKSDRPHPLLPKATLPITPTTITTTPTTVGTPSPTGNAAPNTGSTPATVSKPAQPTPAGPPPGWYLNPDRGTGGERWWDGTNWTDHVRKPPTGAQSPQ